MRSALVIAANGPKDSPDRLRFAEDDGELVAAALKERRANFRVVRIPSDSPHRRRGGLIFEHAESCKPDDTFLTYFSGHGRALKGNLVLQLNRSSSDKPLTTHLEALIYSQCFAPVPRGVEDVVLTVVMLGELSNRQG